MMEKNRSIQVKEFFIVIDTIFLTINISNPMTTDKDKKALEGYLKTRKEIAFAFMFGSHANGIRQEESSGPGINY